ncbi:hypothetical protein BC830DRAFT_185755 [Chytriomyces sp. MP71]|nr:hypothetical protein BC830DRAFT_185755 [Chytriomyces sp. MP71]
MNKEAVILRKEVARKFDDVEGDNAANLWERSVQGEPGKICDAEEEKVDGEIVTPFGKSCGGVLSRPSGKGIITKDKGKAKTDGYAVFDEPLGEEQALLAAMEEKCATATESYRRHMEEMCKKLPGYASGSGTVREVSDECVEQALRQITGGGKIEIQDVDFDSDDDEAQPESPNSESAKFSKDYDISKKQLTSSARGVAGSHENGRKVGGADIQVPDGSVLESSDQKANDINMSEQQCLASIPKPQLHFALATSSYEFENAWKTLKGNEKSWSVYIKTLPSASFSKLLSNVGNPSILPALFRAFQVIALGKFLVLLGAP